MTTSRLIVKVATSTGMVVEPSPYDSSSQGTSGGPVASRKVQVQVRTHIVTDVGSDPEAIGAFRVTFF